MTVEGKGRFMLLRSFANVRKRLKISTPNVDHAWRYTKMIIQYVLIKNRIINIFETFFQQSFVR